MLYGLLCVDIDGKEVLLPNPHGLVHDAVHLARIWFKRSNVRPNPGIPGHLTGTDRTGVYTYFDLTGSRVVFRAMDKAGQPLRDPSRPLKARKNPYHPWIDFKWIRCLKELTGLPLIGESDRNKTRLVAARVQLGTGTVCAFPPFSRDGQHGLWRVKQSNGKEVVSATTDSMLWSRPLPKNVATVRMFVAPLGEKSGEESGQESGWYADLVPDKGAVLLCAVTHAMLPPPPREGEAQRRLTSGRKLTHSRAFARLLKMKKGRKFRFPVPEIASLPRPYGMASSDDVHCECTSCP
jgi:hypothetical protein